MKNYLIPFAIIIGAIIISISTYYALTKPDIKTSQETKAKIKTSKNTKTILSISLEKCATENFRDVVNSGHVFVDLKSDNKIIQMKKNILNLTNESTKLENEHETKLNNWRANNKQPNSFEIIQQYCKKVGVRGRMDLKFEKLDKIQQKKLLEGEKKVKEQARKDFKKWLNDLSANIPDQERKKIKDNSQLIKITRSQIEIRKKQLARQKFLKLSFKDKKDIPEFMKSYELCEIEYNNTPNTFSEKWGS